MFVGGRHYRSIWLDEASGLPWIIDQTRLPFDFEIVRSSSVDEVAEAISDDARARSATDRRDRGPRSRPRARGGPDGRWHSRARAQLEQTRPTAINLRWALDRVSRVVERLEPRERAARARAEAIAICDEDVATCSAIGDHGLALLEGLASAGAGAPLQILTHCNAGWLATIDWGTALAPIYKAHDAGLPFHVWVDETRPRNQGAALTAFELREHGVPHTVIADNAGGHLMQRGEVDLVLVGSDRTTAAGDVCNKIGTYLKALAARAHDIPFYVALPVSSIDWTIGMESARSPIEERSADELRTISGRRSDGRIDRVELFSAETAARNPAFDVTPSALVSGLITERGIFQATPESLAELKRRVE